MHSFTLKYGESGKSGRHGFQPMLVSWMAHAHRVGVSKHVLFVGKRDVDCEAARVFAPCIVDTPSLGYPAPVHEWAQNLRWIYTNLLLRSGFDHVSTDADAFLMQNPFPVLARGKDVAGLTDRLGDGTGGLGYCEEPDSPCQSTGFTFFRATPAVREVVQTFVNTLNGGFEQGLWNPYAIKLVRMGVYDRLPNVGPEAFSNWNALLPSVTQKQGTRPVVVHMGGEQGGANGFWMDVKEHIFRCAQLWLDESFMI